MTWKLRLSRRSVLTGVAGLALVGRRPACAFPATDVTFLFINEVHACRTRDGLSPNCEEEGKTDENLLRASSARSTRDAKALTSEAARA